jgi:hypothetical protein
MLAVFAVIFVATQFVTTDSQNETTLYTRFTSTSGYQTSSTDIRMLLMGVSGEMISRNPVLGIGADNFGIELNKYRAFDAEKDTNKKLLSAGDQVMLERAHKEFLQILSELGVVGGLLFCAMFAGGLALFLSRVKPLKKEPELVLRLGAAAGICGFLVSSLVSSFSFRAIQNGFLFFAVLGLALHSFKRFESPPKSGRLVWGIALSFSLFAVGMFALQATSGYLVAQSESTSNPAKAKALLARAGSIDKTNASVNLSAANLFLTSSDFGKAAEQFDTAIQKGAGTIGIYHWTIRSYQLAREFGKSVAIARKCVEIYPQSISARVLLSHVLKKNGDEKAADREFSTALGIDKHAAATWRRVLEQGALKTSLEARKDKPIIPLADLGPSGAVSSEMAIEKLPAK